MSSPTLESRIQGCLLSGAIGDALGAPLEFLSLAEIRRVYGPSGLRDYAPAYGRLGAITDDTLVNGTTILDQVQAVQKAGGHIPISFGGAAGRGGEVGGELVRDRGGDHGGGGADGRHTGRERW